MTDLSVNFAKTRQDLGLSRAAFASRLGVSADKIKHVESGHQRADHELLFALGSEFDVDLNTLLGLEAKRQSLPASCGWQTVPPEADPDSDFVHVRRYDISVSAGNGRQATDENVVGHYAFSRRWLTRRNLNPDNLAVVRVAGDSMEPKLSNGDLAVIDTTATEMRDGVTYVFRLGDDLLIKRLQILPQRQVNLCSHNPEYSPIQVELASGELTSIGRVVASMHEW
ncbi:XRE family transcriptional regulator [Phaeobacter inhibens]|uniref:XRE family transcriptional regulator n=1 Tax=Phaeobacter inhibens TaxID=221822 RepID=UPI00295EEBA4|nr:XRE family transcriptional regulator [Phaeobacter inhibens]